MIINWFYFKFDDEFPSERYLIKDSSKKEKKNKISIGTKVKLRKTTANVTCR